MFTIITSILTFQEKTYLLLLPIMKDSETQFAGRIGTQLYIKKKSHWTFELSHVRFCLMKALFGVYVVNLWAEVAKETKIEFRGPLL